MSTNERIRTSAASTPATHVDPVASCTQNVVDLATSAITGHSGSATGPLRMTSTGHLVAEDDEGNCEYKWRLTGISADRFQHLVTQMKFRVAEGQGKCLYEIGVADDGAPVGLNDADYVESIETVRRMAEALGYQLHIAYEREVHVDEDAVQASVDPTTQVKGLSLDDLADRTLSKVRRRQTPGARISANGVATSDNAGPLFAGNTKRRRCAELHVTRRQKQLEDLRIAFCGLSGSGKSTLVGVLTQGALDNGSGSVRSTVFNHKHEVDTGCTSSVTNHVMGFDAVGRVTNYDEERFLRTPILSPTLSSGAISNLRAQDDDGRNAGSLATSAETSRDGDAVVECTDEGISTIDYALNATKTIAERSVKLVTLLDLGGQEKYSKTAYFGITSKAPGYACIMAAADKPVVQGIALHVSICLAIRVPFCVVITKCDTVGELELDDIQFEIDDFIRGEARHMGYTVRTVTCTGYDDVLDEEMVADCVALTTVPVFLTSCVEGKGIGYLKTFFHKLPAVTHETSSGPCEVLVDGCFNVPSVGPVLSGFVTKGDVREGQHLLLGPDRHGHFQCVVVGGIHDKGSHITKVSAGTDATFCVGHIPETVDPNRKGTILYGVGTAHPQVCMLFECRVRVIDASGAPIVVGQEPIVHCRNIRQAVKLVAVSSGDKVTLPLSPMDTDTQQSQQILPKGEGVVLCSFLYHPEVLENGSTVLMRWNRSVRVVGTVTRLVSFMPLTSPTMRPTPVDMFDPPEDVPQMHLLPDEVAAAKNRANRATAHSVPRQPVFSPCDAGDGVLLKGDNVFAKGDVGVGLFGSDSEEDTERRRRGKRVKHVHERQRSPQEDGGGNTPTGTTSSSEGLEAIGNDVVRRLACHEATLQAVPPAEMERGMEATHSYATSQWGMLSSNNTGAYTDDASRSPEMLPHGTVEFISEMT